MLACGFALDAVSRISDGRYTAASFSVGLSLYFGAMSYLGEKRFEWVYKTSPEFLEQLQKAKEEVLDEAIRLRTYFIRERKRLEKPDENLN